MIKGFIKKYPFIHEEAAALQLQRSHLQHHIDSADAHFEAAERNLAQGRVQRHVDSTDAYFQAAERHLAQARDHRDSAKLIESNIQNLTGQRPLMNVHNIPSLDRKKTRADDNPSSKTDLKVETPISCLQARENRMRTKNHNHEGMTVSSLKTAAGEKVHVKVEETNNDNPLSTLKTAAGEKNHVKVEETNNDNKLSTSTEAGEKLQVEVEEYLSSDESSNGTVDLTVGDERWVEV